MPYREPLCAFCDLVSVETCARCRCAVCTTHGASGREWCAICDKEWTDDMAAAGFDVAVRVPPPPEFSWLSGSEGRIIEALKRAVDEVRVRRAKIKADRIFATRTPAQIAAWRRTAGVAMRVRNP